MLKASEEAQSSLHQYYKTSTFRRKRIPLPKKGDDTTQKRGRATLIPELELERKKEEGGKACPEGGGKKEDTDGNDG